MAYVTLNKIDQMGADENPKVIVNLDNLSHYEADPDSDGTKLIMVGDKYIYVVQPVDEVARQIAATQK